MWWDAPVRWERLFADLEAELEAAEHADLEAEVADRTRAELSQVRLVDRLRAVVDADLALTLPGAGAVRAVLREVGSEWVLVEEAPGREALIPLARVLAIAGLRRAAAPPGSEGRVVSRLGLVTALRALVRDRAPVVVVLVDGGAVHGTLDRVGADHVDVAEHPAGEPRRAGAVTGVRTVPLDAIALVRRS